MKKSDPPIIVEEYFNTPIEEVWKSITELNQMKKWYFENIPEFKAEVGFETQFNVLSEERSFLHIWKVTEVIPNKKIVYNWTYEEYDGSADMVFELFDEKDSIKLQIRVIVLEDFPDDIPEFTRESCTGGWEYFIKGRLKEYIEKNDRT
ncbi:MAG: SRPBCC domain-containing protein [Melioribacteraceae bacterium]|nr:SRPBCC domain-containing protein [Melioribacteraceae bacterium]